MIRSRHIRSVTALRVAPRVHGRSGRHMRQRGAMLSAVILLAIVLSASLHAQSAQPQASPTAEGQYEGDLEVQYEDFDGGSRLHHFLHANGRRLRLELAGSRTNLLSGARVRVRGRLQNGTLALSSGSTLEALSVASANTFGARSTIVILVNFQNNPLEPYGPASAYDQTFTTTSNFYVENSYQQLSLVGDVFGWYTIAMNDTTCDTSLIARLADEAATARGANLSAYSHKIYAFPQTSACGWWGLGTVGGRPSRAWINGTYSARVVSHEFGHNLGDFHSRSESCDAAGCSVSEYGDQHDTMGGRFGHLNAFQKERLGWLNYGTSPTLTTVSATGTYRIDAYETVTGGSKGLKILKSTDPTTGIRTWYYIEARTTAGFGSGVTPGVLVHTGNESDGDSSYQKDAAPLTSTFDPVIDPGQTFADTAAGLTISTVSADSSGALVSVALGSTACVTAAPTLTISPGSVQSAQPGAAIAYTVGLTNNDSRGCDSATFSLASALPATGWQGAFGSATMTLEPGASQTTSFTLTSPASAFGSYSFSLSTSHGSVTTVSTSVYILAQLTTTVSTDRPSYAKGSTVTITTFVGVGATPLAGVPVAVTVHTPTNGATTMSAVTAQNGYAVVKYRLKSRSSAGTYRASASASFNGSSGTGTVTFSVQ